MDGEYTPPEPFLNLTLCITRVQQAYLRAKINRVPEGRLALLRRFIQECQALHASMAAPPQAMGAAPGMPTPPPGMGEPGMMGEPLGPEGGIPMAGPAGPPMPPGGMPPSAGGPSPDVLAALGGG